MNPHVQYQLDDPGEYTDEHIFVVGGGDAGIENAMGLIADAGQNNTVTLLNRGADFPTAKKPNVDGLLAARDAGRISVLTETKTASASRPAGSRLIRPRARFAASPVRPNHRPHGRRGRLAPSSRPAGVQFTSPDRTAFPTLTPTFESSSKPGHLCDRGAGWLSADQALHEPGL